MLDLSLKNWTGAGADEFMDLSPDADLLAEWAEHDAERSASRHPEQPAYSTQFIDRTVAERMQNATA